MNRGHRLAFCLALAASLCCGTSIAAAPPGANPGTAAMGQYLMNRDAEIRLARSAAPASISGEATIMVLGRHGYEIAIKGSNGFVCMVGRSWLAAFDWPEFRNPKVRAADCLNPPAARSMVPIIFLRSRMVMAGRSSAEVLSAIKVAYRRGQLPRLEHGAMDFMMSKSSYLTDQGGHNASHVMFYTEGVDARDWGSGAAGSPVMSVPYWFYASTNASRMKGLPAMLVSLVMVPTWSDGTPAAIH